MHRNRTWTLDPPEWRTQRNRLLPIEGGDGSTLNLDFTTGVLDPRLTFNRLSTATFVNSSGYVEYAAHNLHYNTNFATITTGTANPSLTSKGWSYVFQSGTATFNTDGSVTMSASAQRIGLYRSAGFAGTGRRLILSVDITSTGTTGVEPSQIINEGTYTNGAYYINGTLWTSGNVVGPCTLSFVYTSNTAGNAFAYFGIGMSSPSTGSATFANPRWGFYGGVNQLAYSPNTSATNTNYLTAEYQAPRFDYNPTNIGESKGLLIEGTSKNFITLSETFSNAIWGVGTGAGNDVVLTTGNTSETLSPNGFNNAAKITKPVPAVVGQNGYGFIRQTSLNLGPPSGPRTISIWVKQPSSNAARYFGLRATGDGFAPAPASRHATFDLQTGTVVANAGTALYTNVSIVPYRNGWYRISATTPSMAGETPAGLIVASYSIVRSDDGEENNAESGAVYIWGPQLEIGTGVSSYIPTGVSQVTRNIDLCSLTESNFTSVFGDGSIGTIICSHEFPRSNGGLAHQPTPWAIGNYNAANARGYSYGSYAVGVGGYGWVYTSASFGSAPNSALSIAKNKCALAYNGLAITAALNGTTASSTGTGTITISSATGLLIGYNSTGATTGRDFINACISSIKVYPTAFTAAQLKIITDPAYVAPTFDLDFTTMSTGADLTAKGLTFTRLSNATFVNSQGYIEVTKSNLFRDSNNIGSANWISSIPLVMNATTAPDNSNTASEIVEAGVGGTHLTLQFTPNIGGLRYTASVYMKRGVNRTVGYIRDNNLSGDALIYYTLTGSGTTTQANAPLGIIASIERVGITDWYRCIFTSTAVTTVNLHIGTASGTAYGNWDFTGIAGNSIYVWGAQVELGSVARPLIVTTSTIKYDDPRFDYHPTTIGQPKGLLIEGSAMNLARYSESLEITGNYWGYNAATRTVESSNVNPTNGTGSISFGPTSNGGSRYCGLFLTGQTTTTAYTFSAWIKAKGTSSAIVSIQNSAGAVNSTVTILSQPSGANASIAGNGGGFPRLSSLSSSGWTKIQVVTSSTLGGTGTLNVFVYPNDTTIQTTADTMFMWGAQLEAGSGASSYIPTGASQGTRNPDNCSIYDNTSTGLLSWLKQAKEGTFFVEATKRFSGNIFAGALLGTEVIAFKDWMLYQAVGSNFLSLNWGTGEQISTYTALSNPFLLKAAVAFSTDSLVPLKAAVLLSINGANSGGLNTNSNITLPITTNIFCIGSKAAANTTLPNQQYAETAIKRITFYPTALTREQLNALTA